MKVCGLFLLCVLLGGASLAETITTRSDVPIAGAGDSKATVFSAPARSARVDVVPAMLLRLGSNSSNGEVTVSVQDVARHQRRYRRQLRRPTDADYLLVNGGLSAAQVDRPAGLLIANGKILSIPNYSRIKTDVRNSCPIPREAGFSLPALLCVDKAGTTTLGAFKGKGFMSCNHAIQAGPMLVEQGKASVCKSEPGKDLSRRTALCFTSGSPEQRELKVIVTQSPVTLYHLARWLGAPVSQGGLACETAMNLGGGDSSGAALFTRDRLNSPAIMAGDGTYPQASFLAVTVR